MTDRSLSNLATPLITARGSRLLSLSLCVAMLSACAIGPDYQRPQAAAPAQYKEAAGWRQANPSDSLARGAWWEREVVEPEGPGSGRSASLPDHAAGPLARQGVHVDERVGHQVLERAMSSAYSPIARS